MALSTIGCSIPIGYASVHKRSRGVRFADQVALAGRAAYGYALAEGVERPVKQRGWLRR